MKHHRLVLAAVLAVGVGSCVDSGGYYGPGGYLTCAELTTCGSCTELVGCGWCQIGDHGACASEPNACWRAKTFTWSWEPSTCPGETDAGAADAPSDAMKADAVRSEAAADVPSNETD
jgi:hypothetical protein